VLLSLFVPQRTILAAPTANLLKPHNPSFEQGLLKWIFGLNPGNTYKIVNNSPKPQCGGKALRLKFEGGPVSSAHSAFVELSPSTQYRFAVWLKIKGTGTDVTLSAAEIDPNNPGNPKFHVVVDNITTTNGKWKRFKGIITSLPVASDGKLFVTHEAGTGKLLIDCAAIKPV
jgi:hypothetical protein